MPSAKHRRGWNMMMMNPNYFSGPIEFGLRGVHCISSTCVGQTHCDDQFRKMFATGFANDFSILLFEISR